MTARKKKGGGKPPAGRRRSKTQKRPQRSTAQPQSLRWNDDGSLADYPPDHPANNPANWQRIDVFVRDVPLELVAEHAPRTEDVIATFARSAAGKFAEHWQSPSEDAVAPIRRLIGAYRSPWMVQARAIHLHQIRSVREALVEAFGSPAMVATLIDLQYAVGQMQTIPANADYEPDDPRHRIYQPLVGATFLDDLARGASGILANMRQTNWEADYDSWQAIARKAFPLVRDAWIQAGRRAVGLSNNSPAVRVCAWVIEQCDAGDHDVSKISKYLQHVFEEKSAPKSAD